MKQLEKSTTTEEEKRRGEKSDKGGEASRVLHLPRGLGIFSPFSLFQRAQAASRRLSSN